MPRRARPGFVPRPGTAPRSVPRTRPSRDPPSGQVVGLAPGMPSSALKMPEKPYISRYLASGDPGHRTDQQRPQGASPRRRRRLLRGARGPRHSAPRSPGRGQDDGAQAHARTPTGPRNHLLQRPSAASHRPSLARGRRAPRGGPRPPGTHGPRPTPHAVRRDRRAGPARRRRTRSGGPGQPARPASEHALARHGPSPRSGLRTAVRPAHARARRRRRGALRPRGPLAARDSASPRRRGRHCAVRHGRSQGGRADRRPCRHAGGGQARRRPGRHRLRPHPSPAPRSRPQPARRPARRPAHQGGPHHATLRGGRTGGRQPPLRVRQHVRRHRRNRLPPQHPRTPTRGRNRRHGARSRAAPGE